MMKAVDTPQLRGKIIDVLRWVDEWVGGGWKRCRTPGHPPARLPCMWQGRQPEELHWARSREGCGMFLDTRILRSVLTTSRLPSSSYNHCWCSRDCSEITRASVHDISSDPNGSFNTQSHRYWNRSIVREKFMGIFCTKMLSESLITLNQGAVAWCIPGSWR